jgi:hypothetical protein
MKPRSATSPQYKRRCHDKPSCPSRGHLMGAIGSASAARLRQAVGRREFTKSTRTHELHVAKLAATVLIAEWRKQLISFQSYAMNPAVLKVLEPISVPSVVDIFRT